VLLLIGGSALAQIADRKETFGAVVGPAALPSGASAAYGYVGAPEVGAGYRQGVGPFELEGRATFNYLLVSFGLDVLAKYTVYRSGPFEVAPNLGLGLVLDTGSEYFDRANFNYTGLRPRVGAVASYKLVETVRGIAALDIPIAFSLNPGGGVHATPLLGVGAEIYVGEDITALMMGQLGVDSIKEPLGVAQTRLGYQLKLGVGWRFF
jgi:hypothetical protein